MVGPKLSPYAPFSVMVYLQDFRGCLDAQRSRVMQCDGELRTLYDARKWVIRETRVGMWIGDEPTGESVAQVSNKTRDRGSICLSSGAGENGHVVCDWRRESPLI